MHGPYLVFGCVVLLVATIFLYKGFKNTQQEQFESYASRIPSSFFPTQAELENAKKAEKQHELLKNTARQRALAEHQARKEGRMLPDQEIEAAAREAKKRKEIAQNDRDMKLAEMRAKMRLDPTLDIPIPDNFFS